MAIASQESPSENMSVDAVILAGGASARMGRDKSRLRLGGRSLVSWIQETCQEAGWHARVVRRDTVPRCGPLGGILTALQRSSHTVCVVLSCDMPFISSTWLKRIVQEALKTRRSVWTSSGGGFGTFPMVLRRADMDRVQLHISQSRLSLQQLAADLEAQLLAPGEIDPGAQFLNVNTPETWREARAIFQARKKLFRKA